MEGCRGIEGGDIARYALKVEGSLDLVEEAKLDLEAFYTLVDVAKMNVDYLEALIRSKGKFPEKGPIEAQVDQLEKLLGADQFHPFSPHVQMKYYNN